MVYTKSELEILLKQFVNLARKKIPIERVILFGSYASGRPKRYSDIDLAVISPYFRGVNSIERIRLLLDFVHTTKMPKLVDVETLGYTPEEYEKPLRYGLLEEIKRKGKVIYEVRS